MIYKEFLPSEKLKDIVMNYWIFEVGDGSDFQFPIKHETIPDSCVSIVLINQPYFKGVKILGQ